jgi:hypothetical protein
VKNFGVPKDLLNDKSSILYQLTEKLSLNERNLIFETANRVEVNKDRRSVIKPSPYVYENKLAY